MSGRRVQERKEAGHECSCLQVNLGQGGLGEKAGVRESGRGTLTSEGVPTVSPVLDSLSLVSRK